jgi:hypothetical protein
VVARQLDAQLNPGSQRTRARTAPGRRQPGPAGDEEEWEDDDEEDGQVGACHSSSKCTRLRAVLCVCVFVVPAPLQGSRDTQSCQPRCCLLHTAVQEGDSDDQEDAEMDEVLSDDE